jgi:hypothetical protein
MFLVVQVIAGLWGTVMALLPGPKNAPAMSLDDITAPTAEEGREIPVLFGTRDIKGPNVVWYGDLKTTAVKKKGGKK